MTQVAELRTEPKEATPAEIGSHLILDRPGLAHLIQVLRSNGYVVIAQQAEDGALCLGPVPSLSEVACGWTDEQSPGHYRLKPDAGQAIFSNAVGAHSWKQFLYPPSQKLLRITRQTRGFAGHPVNVPILKYAFFGIRPCDIQAIELYDRIFLHGEYVDPGYKARRESLFLVAANCGKPAGTCFCASTNTGPRVLSGCDIVLTELVTDQQPRYVVEAGTSRGSEILSEVGCATAENADVEAADNLMIQATAHMGRRIEMGGLKELLYRSAEHPMWDRIAERCLSCANCTMVCPTCFCTTVEDTTDLTGANAERWRRWDSCFTVDFSYIHGGSVRGSVKARFRQWMTHKFAAWIDQFDKPGCVGCGRCITWCPVGIDITAEARALRESDLSGPGDFLRSFHDNANT